MSYPLSSILYPRSRHAFTLVELMISIAMVVLLMVGVHQVFKMSSDTIGIGNQVGAMSRDNRSVQQIFHDDYNRLVRDAPLFILRSGVSFGYDPGSPNVPKFGTFNTEAERINDIDGDPLTQDFNSNKTEGEQAVPGEITPVSVYNNRNHRTDIVGFPARGLFRRATANDGSYTSPLTAQDAFIFYEHVNLPPLVPNQTPPRFYGPGEADYKTNLQNFYSSQWILGRVALLMRDPPMSVNGTPVPDNFIARIPPTGNNIPNLSPLRYDSISTAPNPSPTLLRSRYDLLGASLDLLRSDVTEIRNSIANAGFAADGTNSIWWQPLIYRQPPANPPIPIKTALARFDCNPRITKPISSEAMAQAMPILLNNCSQFIVEFAGDFVTQHNNQFNGNVADPLWGAVTDAGSDGVIDYVVDHSNAPALSAKIRWYGLPRDTNGDRVIPGPGWNGNNISNNDLIDVVPLRDVVRTARDQNGNGALLYPNFVGTAFEREIPPPADSGAYSTPGDYATLAHPNLPAESAFRYTCIFANQAPAMIRIVLKLEDPSGRLSDGQWFEYVVTAQ